LNKASEAKSKAAEAYADTEREKLTAAQVYKLVQQTEEVKRDIVEIRAANKEQNENLIKAMDSLEENMKGFGEMFTKFLISKGKSVRPIIIKIKQ
jgi:hypothetical protein